MYTVLPGNQGWAAWSQRTPSRCRIACLSEYSTQKDLHSDQSCPEYNETSVKPARGVLQKLPPHPFPEQEPIPHEKYWSGSHLLPGSHCVFLLLKWAPALAANSRQGGTLLPRHTAGSSVPIMLQKAALMCLLKFYRGHTYHLTPYNQPCALGAHGGGGITTAEKSLFEIQSSSCICRVPVPFYGKGGRVIFFILSKSVNFPEHFLLRKPLCYIVI